MAMATNRTLFFANLFGLFKQTFQRGLKVKRHNSLRSLIIFSLATLILVRLANRRLDFPERRAGAWKKITEQMSYFLDESMLPEPARVSTRLG
jgi:hypothetical protein